MAKSPKKPKSRPPPPLPSPIPQRRGVFTFDTDQIIVLVHAPVEPVARAFVEHTKAGTWTKDALGQTVTLSSHSYLLFQFNGHPYTIIVLFAGFFGAAGHYPTGDLARALSGVLGTKAIYYANSDTGGATTVEVYEGGRLLERFHRAEEVEFTSVLRDASECPGRGDVDSFVDRLMREHDAFAPQVGMFYGGTALVPGFQATLDITASTLYLDLDYPGGIPDDFPLFARLDFVAL